MISERDLHVVRAKRWLLNNPSICCELTIQGVTDQAVSNVYSVFEDYLTPSQVHAVIRKADMELRGIYTTAEFYGPLCRD